MLPCNWDHTSFFTTHELTGVTAPYFDAVFLWGLVHPNKDAIYRPSTTVEVCLWHLLKTACNFSLLIPICWIFNVEVRSDVDWLHQSYTEAIYSISVTNTACNANCGSRRIFLTRRPKYQGALVYSQRGGGSIWPASSLEYFLSINYGMRWCRLRCSFCETHAHSSWKPSLLERMARSAGYGPST